MNYANTITSCFKCSLALITAFSSVLGRAGNLECLIITIIGVVGFELNRQIISNLANDSFGTYGVFTFGGFMGLALGLFAKWREDRSENCSA